MGSGASTAAAHGGSPRNKGQENSKITVQSDPPNDGRSSAYSLVLRILLGDQNTPDGGHRPDATDDADVAQAGGKSTQMRASVLLMTKLIADMVPHFKSYTVEDPNKDELETAARNRQLLSHQESYLEFYTTVYKHLYDAGGSSLAFTSKTISFKNSFLTELMRLVVFEGSHKASFSERVRYFGAKHKANGISIPDYGLIGEAVLRGMRHVQRIPTDAIWPKVYSRFLRSLVPAMIIAESGSGGVSPANEVAMVGRPGNASGEGSMTDSGLHGAPQQDNSLSLTAE